MKRISFLILSITCLVFASNGQTSSEIEKKYGDAVRLYSVDEKIWMAPEYDSSGQVCQMRLFPKQINHRTNYLGNVMSPQEIKRVIDQLAPPKTRGKKSIQGLTVLGGSIAETVYLYENVSFSFVNSVAYRGKARDESAREAQKRREKDEKEGNFIGAAIVSIQWKDRKCEKGQ